MYPTVSASGASPLIPATTWTSVPDDRAPPELQTFGSDMTMACSSARWDSAYVDQSGSSPHMTSLPEPQGVAEQRAEPSTDSYRGPSCGKITARTLRSLVITYGVAKRSGGDLRQAVDIWLEVNRLTPADLEDVWRDGTLTPAGRLLLARDRMGEDAWLKRGKELLELSAALDMAKSKGKTLDWRKWGREHSIHHHLMPEYVVDGEISNFAEIWGEEVQKLLKTQEPNKYGENQRPMCEALPAHVAEVSSVNDGHRTTPSPLQFSDVLPQDTNFVWWGTPSLRFAPTQPLLSSDSMIFVDT